MGKKDRAKKGKVLIIGGAGFIGSHTADELARRGYSIRILDNLTFKTHAGIWPEYLDGEYEKILGDEKNADDLYKALDGVSYVIDLAAEMDLMPNFSVFFDNNVTSTALLYELIVKHKFPIKKVVIASSQFVYGEGRWECYRHGEVYPKVRTNEQMGKGKWNPVCPYCRGELSHLRSLEFHQDPPNQYAISKYAQELIAIKIGKLYNVPSAAMRYSIVHGPRQSLKNAYSGALRIFTLQLLKGESPSIYEDGKQLRDYVSVYDVARANATVMEDPRSDFENYNVGSGRGYTVMQLAEMVARAVGVESRKFGATGLFRVGDIRHAVSDISKLKKLGWRVKDSEEKIVKEYVKWVKEQKLDQDYLGIATKAMKEAGVVRQGKPAKAEARRKNG